MNPTRPGAGKFLSAFRDAMGEAFSDPVLNEMPSSDEWGYQTGGAYAWKPTKGFEIGNPPDSLKRALEILEEWYAYTGREEVELLESKSVRFMTMESVAGVRRAYPYNKVSSGCAISIFSRTQSAGVGVIRGAAMSEDRGELRFYAVFHVIRASCGDCWCAVKQLVRTGVGYSIAGSDICVVLLGRRVRRVGLIHLCDDACDVNVKDRIVRHGAGVLCGGVFQIVTRKGGYPPHLG